ncbi:MAG: ThiF family adenylyltransferase [Acidobacteria bacterium]|nr:ThiF family adenylyltransferase [Acidobacteriota bacterium]
MTGTRRHPTAGHHIAGRRAPRVRSVVIIGAGGQIGSNLVPHIGKMTEVGRVTLIDQDVYSSLNLAAQMIDPGDIGHPKATAQARKLRRMRPDLRVVPIVAPVEFVPLGLLRADVILSCLDSRRARQEVNRIALRLGVPMIDAGVNGAWLLARVSGYVPGAKHACLECAWSDRDYETLEQVYSCVGERIPVAPTRSISSLGALAASLQAIECHKILAGSPGVVAFDREILIDAAHHILYRTAMAPNPNCRLGNHAAWRIEPLQRSPDRVSLGQALALGPSGKGRWNGGGLRVEASPFIRRLVCSHCGHQRSLLRHRASLAAGGPRCRKCGAGMAAPGFDTLDRLSAAELPERTLRRSLRTLGLRSGDVFSVGDARRENHYEFAG